MRRLVTLPIVLALCALLSACGSSSPKSPKEVRASIVAAALAQKSVHLEETDYDYLEGYSQTFTADVTADSGRARLDSSDGLVEMRLVNDTVYVRGDLDALFWNLARAKRYSGQWISIPRNDGVAYIPLWFLTLEEVVKTIPSDIELGTVANELPRHFGGSPTRMATKPTSVAGSASGTSRCMSVRRRARRRSRPSAAGRSVRRLATPVLAVVLTLCISLSACGSSSSAEDVRASIIAAALAQRSVHWTADDYDEAIGSQHVSAHVSADSARALVRWNWEHQWGKFHLLRVNQMVYFRGDSRSLVFYLPVKLTRSRAKRYAGRWISAPKGDELYSMANHWLTLASIIRDAIPPGQLNWAKPEHRNRVLRVPGRSGRFLEARGSGAPLPIRFRECCRFDDRYGTFSKWNEPVHVQAPANATPIATVRGS